MFGALRGGLTMKMYLLSLGTGVLVGATPADFMENHS
jgi:hypothetical protein